MHPNAHQFPEDPRDQHGNEWTPEALDEYKHWTEIHRNDKPPIDPSAKAWVKNAEDKGKPPF